MSDEHRPLPALRKLVRALRACSARALGGSRPALGCDPRDLTSPWTQQFCSTATELDILYCFRLILGRLPGRPEWKGHRGLAGGDLTEVVRSYLSSKEFSDRHLLVPSHDQYAWVDLDGYGMYVPPLDNEVGKHIFGSHIYEPNVTAVAGGLLRPGMTFVDIGANVGYFALMAAHLVGNSGSVLAFEPNPSNVRFLCASALANGFTNLRVIPFAASDSESILGYSASGTNGVVHRLGDDSDVFAASMLVYSTKLDTVLSDLGQVDMIKIDVEGAEHRALIGASGALRRHRPLILTEFAPYALHEVSGVSGETYLGLLVDDFGYELAAITNTGDLLEFGHSLVDTMQYFDRQATDHIDLLARP